MTTEGSGPHRHHPAAAVPSSTFFSTTAALETNSVLRQILCYITTVSAEFVNEGLIYFTVHNALTSSVYLRNAQRCKVKLTAILNYVNLISEFIHSLIYK